MDDQVHRDFLTSEEERGEWPVPAMTPLQRVQFAMLAGFILLAFVILAAFGLGAFR